MSKQKLTVMRDDIPRCETCRFALEETGYHKNRLFCDQIGQAPETGADAPIPAMLLTTVRSRLRVRRDFGCVLHEPRETKP